MHAVEGGEEPQEHVHRDTGAAEREARLARVVEQLKRRLEQLREENAQLEEMLRHADTKFHGSCHSITPHQVQKLLPTFASSEHRTVAMLL